MPYIKLHSPFICQICNKSKNLHNKESHVVCNEEIAKLKKKGTKATPKQRAKADARTIAYYGKL